MDRIGALGRTVAVSLGILAWGCGGAGRAGATNPVTPSPAVGARVEPSVVQPPVVAAAPSCTPPDAVGGYELPSWVQRGRESPTDPGPSVESTDALTQQLSAVSASDPGSADLLWALGRSRLRDADAATDSDERMRHQAAAIRLLAQVILVAPAYPERDEVLFTLAWSLGQLGQFDRARQVYHRLVRAHPDSRWIPHAYLSFGDYFFREGDMSAAEQFYRKVLQYPPEENRVYGYALYRLAATMARLEQMGEAQARFSELDRFLAGAATVPDRAALQSAARADACGLR